MARRRKPEVQLAHLDLTADQILRDYRWVAQSRQASLVGRREVMSGRAKFGIFGDGKEVAQVAWARAFRQGDFRSGYYRDQTLMFALDQAEIRQFFAQLYAHADLAFEPMSGGRSMANHFATRLLDTDGRWRSQTAGYNSSADLSPTGSQMPRLVGLAYASRLYRELPGLHSLTGFSRGGDEVAWGTIGNATCAEGMFWEAINAIGVLRGPMVLSIWDDEYGISVPNELQLAKTNLTDLLAGFQRAPGAKDGLEIRTVRGWDYPALVDAYVDLADLARREHVPCILHVTELTQPQGHSTSGSHERYKSKRRLASEMAFDCRTKMRDWILNAEVASAVEMDRIDDEAREVVEQMREEAWQAFQTPVRAEREALLGLLAEVGAATPTATEVPGARDQLAGIAAPIRKDLMVASHAALAAVRHDESPARSALARWRADYRRAGDVRYGSHLYSESAESSLRVPAVPPVLSDDSPTVNGFEVVNACFDAMLTRDPRVVAFGEDVGRLGDVNQGLKGLQAKHGELRVTDTGIRECTILGQAIGLALRGLRPIAEIQYLDYLLYALQLLSDDLATLHWRTRGGQKAPVIVRTRGHRLEGTWHAGSPMAGIIHLVRGVNVLVPRDMTRAAGFYNTLLASDDPGLVVEVLNGYRLKERLPDNIGSFTLPVGVPEILRSGADVSLVTYGACCRIAMTAADRLAPLGIDVEVIDVQSLLPFDLPGIVGQSVAKTGRVLFVDEDVPGGTTAYLLQEVLEQQGAYAYLDSPPRTLPAKPHRTAYGTDGDYWSKPNVEDVVTAAYDMMSEVDPHQFPVYWA